MSCKFCSLAVGAGLFLIVCAAAAAQNPPAVPPPQVLLPPGIAAAFGLGKVQATPEPEWSPLDLKVQEWVDRVLEHWEKRSGDVKNLQCKFHKWEYDPSAIPQQFRQLKTANKLNEMPFTKYSVGAIQYAAPNKGLFRTEQLQVIIPGQLADGKPQYSAEPKENGDHWLTDGKRVFAFDALTKRVIESPLPEDSRINPLDLVIPAILRASAKEIKTKYWIRPLQGEEGEYVLEAIPKSRHTWTDSLMVQIVFDNQKFLPVRLQVFESDWSPTHPHRTAYRFHDLIENDRASDESVFSAVKTPPGWKYVVLD